MNSVPPSARRDTRVAHALLAVMVVAFVAFCAQFVPRLTNVHFGDVEFTGWSGPLGSRILHGDRPYVDFGAATQLPDEQPTSPLQFGHYCQNPPCVPEVRPRFVNNAHTRGLNPHRIVVIVANA